MLLCNTFDCVMCDDMNSNVKPLCMNVNLSKMVQYTDCFVFYGYMVPGVLRLGVFLIEKIEM